MSAGLLSVKVANRGELADRRVLTGEATFKGSAEVQRATFAGPTSGIGNVMMLFGTDWVRVEAPERFGDTFNADWVRAFFGVTL